MARQELELMFHNNGLLHHNVIIAAGRTVLSAMLANNFSTSTCFVIFELIKFMCLGPTLSYSHKNFNQCPHQLHLALAPRQVQPARIPVRVPTPPHKCGYLQLVQVNTSRT